MMKTLTKTTYAALTAATVLFGAMAAGSTSASAASFNVAPAVAGAADAANGNVTDVRWRGRGWRYGGYGAAAAAFGFVAGAAIASQSYRGRDCGYVTIRKKGRNRYGERIIIKKRVYVCED